MKLFKQVRCSHLVTILTVLVLCTVTLAQTAAPPRIFYTDLQSGPCTGGQNNQGAIVTIYGTRFGTARGASTVTVGGVQASRYLYWSDSEVAIQIGSSARTGNIIVNVSGVSSNGMPFTVRPGAIYFVSVSGRDTQRGTYNKPWRTLGKAVSTMVAGDITYAMNGVSEPGLSGSSTAISVTGAGSSALPKAIVAYPGATATIGSSTGAALGVAAGTGANYWLLAGLTLRGAGEAIRVSGGTGWRVVGNDISCPNGSGTTACVNVATSTSVQLLGNNIHDNGSTTATARVDYDSVQFSASRNIEVGWNKIVNTRSCRALAFNGTSANQYGVKVHDNTVRDAVCDGISLGNVDPSQGAVTVYNNIIRHVGTGPAPGGVEGSYACVAAGGSGTGAVQVFNNTMSDCGGRVNADSGAISASTPMNAANNIISLASGQDYVAPNTASSYLSGSNNLFWGSSSATPAPFTSSVTSDPMFVDVATGNFRLQSSSAAVDAGTNTGMASDADGNPRPQGKAYDIGAYEFAGTPDPGGAGQTTLNPTSLTFSNVVAGSSSTQSVQITNTGTADTTISQLSVTGAGFTATGMTLPMTLAPQQSTSFTVTFAPQSAGTLTGSVAVVSTSSNSPTTVQLSGTATSATGSLSAPASLSFGKVIIGSSGTQSVTLTSGTASVRVSSVSVTGNGYTVSGLPALPVTLAAGQSLTFSVRFAPTVGGTATGSVAVASDASNSPNSIALSGVGGHIATLSWTPSTSTGVVGYNVYRGTVSGGSYTKLTGGAISGTTYSDTTINAGTTYYYVVTAVASSGAESVYSNQATGIVPTP